MSIIDLNYRLSVFSEIFVEENKQIHQHNTQQKENYYIPMLRSLKLGKGL